MLFGDPIPMDEQHLSQEGMSCLGDIGVLVCTTEVLGFLLLFPGALLLWVQENPKQLLIQLGKKEKSTGVLNWGKKMRARKAVASSLASSKQQLGQV